MDADARNGFAAGGALGFGLSGAFDVAVFHLVLQWHHFITSPDTPAMLRIDGWLLVGLLTVALVGTLLLWRTTHALVRDGLGRVVGGGALLGAALFNGGDILVDHFMLELHRLNMGVDSLWPDLAWLAGSVALAVAGALILRAGLRQRPTLTTSRRPPRS